MILMLVLGPLFLLNRLYWLHRILTRPAGDQESEQDEEETLPSLRDWLTSRAAAVRALLRRIVRPDFGLETVVDLYKNLLRFGEEQGLARPAFETPYDYLEPLCARYPQQSEDFLALTDAYVAARYGERLFSRSDIQQLQAAWRRIRDAGTEDLDERRQLA